MNYKRDKERKERKKANVEKKVQKMHRVTIS